MKPKSIKIQRTESLLKELIPEALASMSDEEMTTLSVTEVDCSRGKHDADVYLDPPFLNEKEQNQVLSQLRKSSGYLATYILAETGWFRCPKFHFKFDHNLEKMNRLEQIFEQIGKK